MTKQELQDLQAKLRYEARKNGKKLPKIKKDRKVKWLVPFDPEGNLLWQAVPKYTFDNFGRMKLDMSSIIWKEKYTFSDTLLIGELIKKRSALYVVAKSLTSMLTYNIFLKDLLECLKTNIIINGQISGTWEFVKKSSYFGVRLLRTGQTSGMVDESVTDGSTIGESVSS